ncbi:MAG: hypothetical protein H6884_03535 [Rhodobiaceae bacterium]|nr:hypothetical protein [Rhodobiaceae bacterium]MCC0053108.1 hypothetical protein [Rhodobiaceae bacterium]
MTSVDQRVDTALRELGRRSAACTVVTIGRADGIAHRTMGYAQLFGWTSVDLPEPEGEATFANLQSRMPGRVGVLHIETRASDWAVLSAIDLQAARPAIIRVRREGLGEANLHRAVRHLQRLGYAIEWFYDELVAVSAAEHGSPGETAVPSSAAGQGNAGGDPRAAVYVISYNAPEQFRLWLDSAVAAAPGLLNAGPRFLLDNSTDPATHGAYDELAAAHGFTVLRNGNLGITGGRAWCARHFDALADVDALYWFEDDMLLAPPGQARCRNGFATHVGDLHAVLPAIARREGLDFLKLSFTEVFGDHHLNWAWYHLDPDTRAAGFPGGTFRTAVSHTSVEADVSYLVGNVHFSNWPMYLTRQGNRRMFLDDPGSEPTEGACMARAFRLQLAGELRGGVLLASPVNHCRRHNYAQEDRREH